MISGQDSNFHAAKVPADAATDAPRRAPDDQAGGAALAGGAVRAAQPGSVLISVVVPAYNVAPYLEQCLTSILDQEGVNLELIVVDDGATDGSGRIADQCAERDARVRVIHQENSGPSASRNKGMAAARGAYLAFLDGDDYVLPGAYAALLESIQSNGADFVTANALRLTNGRQHQSGLHARAIEQDLRATNIRANPALLWDTVVWNKLFRIDFYREKIGDFADMLYEDMFPMCKAHLLANHVNVLSQHVCVWRSREDNSSITQDRGSPEHLVDRLDSYLQISDYLQAHAPHLLVPLQAKQLTNDFFLYFPSLALGNDRFKALFSGRIRTLVSSFRTESFAGLTPPARLVYELLMQGRIDDIEAMLPFCGRHARHYQTTCVAGRFIAELPFRTGPNRLASPIYDVTEQLPYEAAVTDVALTDAGCRVSLRVAVAHLDAAALAQCDIRLHMAEGNGRQALPMHLVRQADTRAAGDDDAPCLQFFFDVDFIELAQAVSKPPRLREFVIDISVGHLHRRGPLSIGAKLPERWRTRQFGEWVIRPQLSETSLQIWMAATKILLTAVHKSSDQALDFVLYTKPGIKPAFLRFFYPFNGARIAQIPVRQEDGQAICSVPLDQLSACDDGVVRSISVSLVDANGKTARIWCGRKLALPALLEFPGSLVELKYSSSGNINLKVRRNALRLSAVDVRDGRLLIQGKTTGFTEPGRIALMLRDTETGTSFPLHAHRFDEQFEATINLLHVERSPGCHGPVPLGSYELAFSKSQQGANLDVFDIGTTIDNRKSWTAGLELTLQAVDDGVRLRIANHLGAGESGPDNQIRLQKTVYAQARSMPTEQLVLFDSWNGKRIDDNPLAIYRHLQSRHLGLDLRFAIANAGVYVPPGVKVVRKWSAQYWKMLGAARLVVVNDRLPQAHVPRDGQLVLQTWHGTPLKKIGHDIACPAFDDTYLTSLDQEVPKWNLLISPNPASTVRLRSAFRYSGEVIETGYPRNDALTDAGAPAARAQVRALLGIAPDEFCILYAPTWRDTQKIRPGRYAMKLMPDLDRLQKSLPGSQLIFRAHHLMAAQIGAHDNAKVQDVSAFPDVAQLYLAADVLISDYSSVIVDYAITGKPILLYTPDLEEYGGHVRGFYGDFAGEVPAPFLKDEAALLDALSQVKSGLLEETCRERYARWQAKFCALEDGNAARRVVERVLPSLLGDGGSQGQV